MRKWAEALMGFDGADGQEREHRMLLIWGRGIYTLPDDTQLSCSFPADVKSTTLLLEDA